MAVTCSTRSRQDLIYVCQRAMRRQNTEVVRLSEVYEPLLYSDCNFRPVQVVRQPTLEEIVALVNSTPDDFSSGEIFRDYLPGFGRGHLVPDKTPVSDTLR